MEVYTVPLVGGILIGLSATLLLLTIGRIAGISGIVWGGITATDGRTWRWLFIGGLILGPVIVHQLMGRPIPAPGVAPWWLIVIAGFAVGYGTRLGCGCTSGHGVCGLGRLSVRSLVATLTFMATGIATVFIMSRVFGVGV